MEINPNQSKYNYFLESSRGNMESIALTFGENIKVTRADVLENIDEYEKILNSKGVGYRDVIGFCGHNTPESVYLLYALNKVGAIVVGLSPFEKKYTIKKDIALTKPKMVITTEDMYGNFRNLKRSMNFSTLLYSPIESIEDRKMQALYWIDKIRKGNFTLFKNSRLHYLLKMNYDSMILPEVPYIEGELSDILFTGGSSGYHKGVDLNDIGLNSSIEGMKKFYDEHFFDETKTYLGQIPFGHMAFGRSILHAALCNNMTFALTLKAMPEDFYSELVRTQAHGASGGPPHWTSLIEPHPTEERKYIPRRDLVPNSLSNLQIAFSGGEAKKANTDDPINEALLYCGSQTILGDGLGATETWGSNILNTGNFMKQGRLGVPLPNLEVKLINPKTNELAEKGEKGLLYLSGNSVMIGYHENPEETNKVISYDENGKKWLNLGDYLREGEDGFYTYEGREKRCFVSGCDNIYPEPIEELLQSLPEIREVVITPIPDDILQNIPSYHISLYSDSVDTSALERKINKLVSSQICDSAVPGKIEYSTKPLVRMKTNSKIDFEYYKKKDANSKGDALRLKL